MYVRNSIRCMVGLAFAAASFATSADTVGLHIGSQHYPAKDFNNFNPGAYYRWDSAPVAGGIPVIGGYYNSERRASFYGGLHYQWGYAGVTIGAITGYSKPVLPLVAPSIMLPITDRVAARVVYLPKVEKRGAHVVHLMLEFKL